MKHTKDEIAAEVRQMITDLVGYTHTEITDEKSLDVDLGIDLFGKVELALDAEERFVISISDKEEDETNTVGALIGIVVRKLEEKGKVAA